MKILRRLAGSLFLFGTLSGAGWALPQGAQVVNGTVQINNSGTTQTITQGSNQAIINWNGFNIDVGELVNFVQPSTISAILNRVVGQDPSAILGSLTSNGRVFLVNPNGIIFGQSAHVDVGSLVASTLNISDDNFLAGNLQFEQAPDKALASVINQGTIKIDDHGYLVLTGPMVANEGVILARVGQVALAAGEKSTVSFDPTGMIQVALPTGSQADNGIVSLTREATSDLLASVVTTSATPAGKMVVRDGKTFLEVDSGTLVNTGQILAEGLDNQKGGKIVLDSTGHTILGEGSLLSAAGQGSDSGGGEVFVLSDGQSYSAKGSKVDVSGSGFGDGGFVEQSSKYGRVAATIDLGSDGGRAGTLLIDPERIVVESGAGGSTSVKGTVVYLSENFLESQEGNIVLPTESGVTFESLTKNFIGETEVKGLKLMPDTNLTINLAGPGDGTAAIIFEDPGDRISLSGTGAFTLNNSTGNDVQDLYVTTQGGDITLSLAGADIVATTPEFRSGFESNTGTIRITAGNVGTTNSPVEMNGSVVLTTTGNVFIDSLDSVSLRAPDPPAPPQGPAFAGPQALNAFEGPPALPATFNTFTGTGEDFIIAGPLTGQAFTVDISGTIVSEGGVVIADSVSLTGGNIGGGFPNQLVTQTSELRFDSSGDVHIFNNTSAPLNVSNSSAAGAIELAANGNLTFDTIEGDYMDITVDGNITGGTLITHNTSPDTGIGIRLQGGTVNLDTQTVNLSVSAQGAATISNTSLTTPVYIFIDAQGEVRFDALGDLIIANVDGGDLVSLTSGGDMILLDSVRGDKFVSVDAGGNITGLNPKIQSFDKDIGEVVIRAGGNITTSGPALRVVFGDGEQAPNGGTLTVTALGPGVPQPPLGPVEDPGPVDQGEGQPDGQPVQGQVLAKQSVQILAAQNPDPDPDADDPSGVVNGNIAPPNVTEGAGSGLILYNGVLLAHTVTPPPPPTPDPPTPTPPTPDPPTPTPPTPTPPTPTPPTPTPPTPTPPTPTPPTPTPPTPTPPTPTPPTPTPPTPTPPTPTTPTGPTAEVPQEVGEVASTVRNELGQQAGQLIDDGSVGSAANDGVVEQSPTQKLVAKLMEATEGGEGAGFTTGMLITMEVDELGQVKVTLSDAAASPVDVRIDSAEGLRANDVLDLDAEEMGEVAVSLYYDPATDRLIMAVNLSADHVMDLDVSEFQEIPIDLNYVFLSDPKLIIAALRANDILDLEVEDLGLIPIDVHVEGDAAGAAKN